MQNYKSGAHSTYDLHCHIIFITKYRANVLTKPVIAFIQECMNQVCVEQCVDLIEFNGEKDHVHLLINYSPTIQISSLVNQLKGRSSRLARFRFPLLRSHWSSRKSGALWSPSYFAGSVGGAPIEVLKRYIQQQDRPK